MLSILIAHKHDPENDKALMIALDCIVQNTRTDYQLLIDASTPACPYQIYNALARQATGKWIVFSNSDVFFAPGWDVPLLEAAQPDRIVTGVLVESGAIAVNALNHEHNFGMRPDTFDREAFETWVRETPQIPKGEGWFFPSLHHRQSFLDMGGFDTSLGTFPYPLDEHYWNAWRKAGKSVHRVASFGYHLQQYSFKAEQEKEVRHA